MHPQPVCPLCKIPLAHTDTIDAPKVNEKQVHWSCYHAYTTGYNEGRLVGFKKGCESVKEAILKATM